MPIETRRVASGCASPRREERGRRPSANERRNTILTLVLLVVLVWALLAWVALPGRIPGAAVGLVWHKIASVLAAAVLSVYLFFALGFEKIR